MKFINLIFHDLCNRLTAAKTERVLLRTINKKEGDLRLPLYNLVVHYIFHYESEAALKYLEQLMVLLNDPEQKALFYLTAGQYMEMVHDYRSALLCYHRARPLEPEHQEVWYLINNNIGYCLAFLDNFAEAEPYCLIAISIDPLRHNAYKNLGLSLEGQQKYVEAADNYIKASMLCPADKRALNLLENLVARIDSVAYEIPDIEAKIARLKEQAHMTADQN